MMDSHSSEEDEDQEFKSKRPKNAAELQRLKLEKLMKNPEREAFIVNKTNEKKPKAFEPHEFVRNVMGASAGAGSGEFDIYRGCRRRQLIRQEYINTQADKQKAEEEFQKIRMSHLTEAEQKTAKKRAKRLKQKEKLKLKKSNKPKSDNTDSNSKDSIEKIDDEELEEIDLNELEDNTTTTTTNNNNQQESVSTNE